MEFNYKNIIKVKNKKIRRILDICDRKDKEIERLNSIKDKANKIINTIFKKENWYQNYDYNDLVDKLKEIQGVLNE